MKRTGYQSGRKHLPGANCQCAGHITFCALCLVSDPRGLGCAVHPGSPMPGWLSELAVRKDDDLPCLPRADVASHL